MLDLRSHVRDGGYQLSGQRVTVHGSRAKISSTIGRKNSSGRCSNCVSKQFWSYFSQNSTQSSNHRWPRYFFPGVPDATDVRGVVVLLEFRVDLDDPGHSFRHVGRDDCCREHAMCMWRVRVTDVMQERRDDVLDRLSVIEGPGCRLQ